MPENKLYGDKASFDEISYNELGQESTILVNNTGDDSGNIYAMNVSNFKGEKGDRGYPGNVVFPDGFVATAAGYELIGKDTYKEMREIVNNEDAFNDDDSFFLERGDIIRANTNKRDVVAGGDLRLMPIGAIIMWGGLIVNIPNGWVLCDGNNGTHDLRDKFIIGAGYNYTVGNEGGNANAIVVAHTHTGYTSEEGAHSHSFSVGNYSGLNNGEWGWTSMRPGTQTTNTAGQHNHNLLIDSQGITGTNANLPPYYALCYIQFKGY